MIMLGLVFLVVAAALAGLMAWAEAQMKCPDCGHSPLKHRHHCEHPGCCCQTGREEME